MDFDWKETLAAVAPVIAGAFGTPLAAAATRVLALELLGKDDAQDEELSEAVRLATPEQMLELKRADLEFKQAMRGLDIDLERVHAGDRNSARVRQIETKDNATGILATVIVAGFFAVLAVIAFVPIPASAKDAMNILLGALTVLLAQVGNYYFGSTRGSQQKTKLLALQGAQK